MSQTEQEITLAANDVASVVDVCRCVMLMEPVASDFNSILMTDPVQRVKDVGKCIQKAAEGNDVLRKMAANRNVFPLLFAAAKSRLSGQFVAPKAFLPDLVRGVKRESQHV